MAKRLLVFDCDGTLVDSSNGIADAMTSAFAFYDLECPPREIILRQTGLPGKVMVARMRPDLSDDDCHLIDRQYVDALRTERTKGVLHPLYGGIRALLADLEGRHDLAIATGMGRPGLDHVLSGHGLMDYFVSLQTADVNPGKPDPTMLNAAMKETGREPAETIMIGDTTYDGLLAKNAGVEFIGVAWGFHEKRELSEAGAGHVAADTEDLSRIVSNSI